VASTDVSCLKLELAEVGQTDEGKQVRISEEVGFTAAGNENLTLRAVDATSISKKPRSVQAVFYTSCS